MAEIVFGFGTSHGPLLATPPHEWDLRANVDRKNKALAYRDGTFNFEQLYELRKNDHFEKQNAIDVRTERDSRCQKQLDVIAERLKAVNPDALVIVGDDHHEWFLNDIQPTFSIFHGKEVFNRGADQDRGRNQNRKWRRLCDEDLLSAEGRDLSVSVRSCDLYGQARRSERFRCRSARRTARRQRHIAPARAFLRFHLSSRPAQQTGSAHPDPGEHLLSAEPANPEALPGIRPCAGACDKVL